jgi:uncharacterized protein
MKIFQLVFLVLIVFQISVSQYVFSSENQIDKFEFKWKRTTVLIRKTFPASNGLVSDFEHVFTKRQLKKMTARIEDFTRITKIELAVVSLDSTLCRNQNFDAYTQQLANVWGVGNAKENNGILIGISKQYHKVRINNGKGIEPRLNNEQTKKIIETSMIPMFKKKKYYQGILNGLEALEMHFIQLKVISI